jgi:hypothetical protein
MFCLSASSVDSQVQYRDGNGVIIVNSRPAGNFQVQLLRNWPIWARLSDNMRLVNLFILTIAGAS